MRAPPVADVDAFATVEPDWGRPANDYPPPLMVGRFSRIPRVVLLASATFAALLGSWSFVNPVFAPPDEISHADVVFHLATGADYPEYDERQISQGVTTFALTHALVRLDEPASDPAGARRTRSSAGTIDFTATFDDLGGEQPTAIRNQIPQHPPLYYWSSAMVLRSLRFVHGGQLSMHHEVHLLRLMNVLLLTPLPLLAWATARRLGAPDAVGIVASLVPLTIPQLTHVGASINNDNLFLVLCAALALPLASAARGDRRIRTALVAGTLAGLAMLSKGFGVVLPIWIVCCYAAPAIRSRPLLRPAIRAAAVAVGTTVVVGSWFTVRNLLVHGTPSPSLHSASTAAATFSPDAGAWLGHFPGFLTQGFWGYFGYYEIQLGLLPTILGSVLVVGTLASAFLSRPRTDGARIGVGRVELAALLAILPLLLAFVALVGWDLYTKTAYLRNFVQGRYLFGVVVPVAVGTAVGAARLFGRRAAVVVLAVAVTMQARGLQLALNGWWGESGDSLVSSYGAVAQWNPWPVPLAHLTTGFTVLVVAALIFDVVQQARRTPGAGPA